MKSKFKKVVVLDTVIFYPEHEEILKSLVEKPKIERVPLEYDQRAHAWRLPKSYRLPKDATIILWPSSLPEVIDKIDLDIHEKLCTAQCWAPGVIGANISAQNLLNRIYDADCILTCWTNIPDEVLDAIQPRAIITWTHEFEHRLNVEKARRKGIYVNCVADYGTDAVAELELDGLLKLVERNKVTNEKACTPLDIAIGVTRRLFDYYRKSSVNERNTRKGRFTHQFHKLGQAQLHYGSFERRSLDDLIPEQLLQGKTIGILDERVAGHGLYAAKYYGLSRLLHDGLDMKVTWNPRISQYQPPTDFSSSNFYKFLAEHETIIYDSIEFSPNVSQMIRSIKGVRAIDIQKLPHYDVTFKRKTIGIIGFGRIGERVHRAMCNLDFEMGGVYTGPRDKQLGCPRFVGLDELLSESDIVSVNVRAHVAEGLLDEHKLRLLKPGAYFINSSDGNTVDQKELTRLMRENKIYAALDVYPGLPTTGTLGLDDNPRGKIKDALPHHVLTYRAGWITQESVRVKTYKLLGHMIEALQI